MADDKNQDQNRQNEIGQQGKQPDAQQDKQPNAQQGEQPSGQQQGGFASQQQPTGQQGGQSSSGQADLGTSSDTDTLSKEQNFGAGSGSGERGASDKKEEGGFVGSQGDSSSDYLKDEANPDFAREGQGATSQNENLETGQSNERKSEEDDTSST